MYGRVQIEAERGAYHPAGLVPICEILEGESLLCYSRLGLMSLNYGLVPLCEVLEGESLLSGVAFRAQGLGYRVYG